MNSRRRTPCRGYASLELLVAVAVVALLPAVMLPPHRRRHAPRPAWQRGRRRNIR
ncbi:MAG: hypothetical protein K2Q09_00180 [Phycisphaerales bacterium]|nr:hypothetical protein [Phycisphaerales bacterium]